MSETIELTVAEEEALDAAEATHKAGEPDRAFTKLRRKRNQALVETDWRFRSDLTPSQEWIDYSQALRDLPAQYDTESVVGEITWPTKPD